MATRAVVEYRDTPTSDISGVGFEVVNWTESRRNWNANDLRLINKVCGYQKYRARLVETA